MANATAHTTTDIHARRVSFDRSLGELPRGYAGDGNVIWGHLWAHLSAAFPAGERFFIDSVRHYKDRVTDPTLKAEVRGFIGQEAVHTREHEVLNRRLNDLGFGTLKLESWTERDLARMRRWMSPERQLAYTIAFEHITAVLAETLLRDDETAHALGELVDVFRWHALEELEHKSVAFDVYRAAGLSERVRISMMRIARFELPIGLAIGVTISVLFDRTPGARRRALADLAQLRRSKLISKETWRALKAAQRPGFHPTDHNTTELVNQWRERLFGTEGELNELLSTGASA